MNVLMKKTTLVVFALVFSAALFGQIGTFPVQGVLNKSNGQLVDDGAYDIIFKLYTIETGGTAVWTETQNALPVLDGFYSALLGSVASLDTVPFDRPYFLGVTVNGEEMLPRPKLSNAPYALAIKGTANKLPSNGNVGINSSMPATTLDANGSVSKATATTTEATYAVNANDHTVFLDLAGAQSVTLPSAALFPRREIMLVNKTTTAKTTSGHIDLSGQAATLIPSNGKITLRSNGSEWRTIDLYSTSPTGTKAIVQVTAATASVVPQTFPSGTPTTINWLTEFEDNLNAFSTTTFTAPRKGLYTVSGIYHLTHISASGTLNPLIIRLGGTCPACVTNNQINLTHGITTQTPNSPYRLLFMENIEMDEGQTLSLILTHSMGFTLNGVSVGNNPSHLIIYEN